MNTTVPASVYAQRRAHLAAQLGSGGIAIIPTALERPRNRDSDFLFRHDSYFYYLTGFTEPGACLVLAHDGRSTLSLVEGATARRLEVKAGLRDGDLGPSRGADRLGSGREPARTGRRRPTRSSTRGRTVRSRAMRCVVPRCRTPGVPAGSPH